MKGLISSRTDISFLSRQRDFLIKRVCPQWTSVSLYPLRVDLAAIEDGKEWQIIRKSI